MYIRELQGRVQFLRHDLPVGFAEQALQDAARYVARKTGIIRVTSYGYAPANVLRLDLPTFMDAAAGDFRILRPTEIMGYAGTSKDSVFIGTLSPSIPGTTNVIPAAGSATAFGFYMVTADCTPATVQVSDGTNLYTMAAGDSIQNVDGVWKVTQRWKYSMIRDKSKGRTFGTLPEPLNQTGRIGSYLSDNANTILLTPVPQYDTPIIITCSIVPNKEFENIDIPPEAEDAIIHVARERILSTPNKSGGGADHVSAAKAKAQADGEISLVRAIAEGGYGEVEMAAPPLFGI
jgi:hypothetical protein